MTIILRRLVVTIVAFSSIFGGKSSHAEPVTSSSFGIRAPAACCSSVDSPNPVNPTIQCGRPIRKNAVAVFCSFLSHQANRLAETLGHSFQNPASGSGCSQALKKIPWVDHAPYTCC